MDGVTDAGQPRARGTSGAAGRDVRPHGQGADPQDGLRRVAIVGAGLVGGSVALAAMAAGTEQVRVYDADDEVRERARARGIGHVVHDDLATAVHGAQLVVIAIPSLRVAPVVEEIAKHADMQAIITDVSSLKSHVVLEVEATLVASHAGPSRFIGGHPMAGSETSGPDAADANLFQSATWALTPTDTTDDQALRALSRFVSSLGARTLVVSPERHDELVAVVSHLPQAAASCLADVAAETAANSGQAVLALAGGGFRDTTRIAASDPDLWVGILEGNRDAVLDALELYTQRLDELAAALRDGDRDALRERLRHASQARRQLVPKEGPREVVDLVVALDDRPGALAVATGALGEAGINVEDLTMRHATAGDRGALILRVESSAAPRGLDALARRGLAAHLQSDETDRDPGRGER
jgi:prephenate dehydrogenase